MKTKVIVMIILIIVGILFAIQLLNKKPIACTADAKICPDGTGVGRVPPDCEFKPCPGVEENRIYCTEEQRQADACIEIYQPVCGYSNPDKIKCLVYPCATTYPNSCFACIAEDVWYWVDGIC